MCIQHLFACTPAHHDHISECCRLVATVCKELLHNLRIAGLCNMVPTARAVLWQHMLWPWNRHVGCRLHLCRCSFRSHTHASALLAFLFRSDVVQTALRSLQHSLSKLQEMKLRKGGDRKKEAERKKESDAKRSNALRSSTDITKAQIALICQQTLSIPAV